MKVVKKKDDRKNFLINPTFQLSIVGIFIAISLIVNLIYFYSMNISFEEFFNLGKQLGLPKESEFFKFIGHQKNQFTNIFLATSLLSSAILIIFGILLSHKIAGPVYRITEDLKSMIKDKKIKEVHFRKGDFFIELTETFNSFLKSYKKDKSKEED